MVNSCSAFGCTNRQSRGSGLQFHRFPLNRPEVLKKWVKEVRRKNFTPTKYSFLCSDHFLSTDYQIRPGATYRLLKEDAFPSVFKEFPDYLQKPIPTKRRLLQRIIKEEKKVDDIGEISSTSTTPDLSGISGQNSRQRDVGTQCIILSPTKKRLRRKIKILQQQVKRRNLKIKGLQHLLKEIKKQVPGSSDVVSILEEQFSGFPLQMLLHERKCKVVKTGGVRYTASMKDFAKTLFYYSPKAYRFVRKLFTLPHPSTIRNWMNSFKCEPGFLSEVLEFLKLELIKNIWLQDCCLVFDSMSIRKQLVWEPVKGAYVGNVEFGDNIDNTELASEVLVILLVSMTKRFKCPIGYFFVNKINSSMLSTLLDSAIRKLDDIGIRIWNVTCDGAPANVQSFKNLGCNFDVNSIRFNCKFTTSNSLEVNVMFDACHMLKLARNTLADKKVIKSVEGDVQWHFIDALNDLQNTMGLRFANKLTSRHVNFRNSIMKVKLAAQTLSSAVADAMDYLQKNGDKQFQNSEATIHFIRNIDRLFDILNSRNPFANGFKKSIRASNVNTFKAVFLETTEYIKTLKLDNIPVFLSGRKMFAIGFIVTMQSTLDIAYKLLYREENPLKYLLTYKMSQDHLELFFSCVRARGGSNNNPNCVQFKNSLRQLLFTKNIAVETGNCCTFDSYDCLQFRSEKRCFQNSNELPEDKEIIKYVGLLENINLSLYAQDILHYISGYLVKTILTNINCQFCMDILVSNDNDHSYSKKNFTRHVNRGNLILPSNAVYLIVKEVEKSFQTVVIKEHHLHKNVKANIIKCAKENICNKQVLFFFPNIHPINVEFGTPSHEYTLFHLIANKYINIRANHYGNQFNLQHVLKNKSSVRPKLTKLILFNNV